ncbi:hypothetical protein Q8A73_006505 [Channa argus]|nr:hypothetical protein Q8A73_006505 [Channa argus]
MAFAIDEINKNSNLLPNVTLGYTLYDNCGALIIALSGALSLASGQEDQFMLQENCSGTPPVLGIVGDSYSTFSIAISHVLGLYKMSTVSYFATCSCLTDRQRFPSFFRTIPSDAFQVRAVIEILKHFGWTWVGLVVTDDDYGFHVAQSFQSGLVQSGVCCLAYLEVMPWDRDPNELRRIVHLIKASTARVIIVFVHEIHMIQLMEEVVRQDVKGRQWIGSEAWTTAAVLQAPLFMPYLGGTLGIAIRRGEIPGLRDFLIQLRPDQSDNKYENNMVKQFWEDTFQCRFEPVGWVEAGGALCTGQEDVENAETEFLDVSNLRPEYNVYKAVYALAYALDDMVRCEPGRGPFSGNSCATLQRLKPWQLVHYLQKVNFTTSFGDQVSFDENGDVLPIYDIMNWLWLPDGTIKVQHVGEVKKLAFKSEELTIYEDQIFWNFESRKPPRSVCSESCPPGTRMARKKGQPMCCFDCVPCSEGKISNKTDSMECTSCPEDFWSSPQRDHCDIYIRATTAQLQREKCPGTTPVIGIVGDHYSTFSIAISDVLGLYRMPIVSYYATCSCLNDRKRFPSFFRTIPSDAFQVHAMFQILKHFGWTWVGLLVSDDDYGLHVAQAFQSGLPQTGGGCLAYLQVLPWDNDPNGLRGIVQLIKTSTARVVIVFAHEIHMIQLMEEVVRQNVTGLQWIASETWTTTLVLQTPRFMPYLSGTLGIAIRRGEIPGLRDFLLQIRPDENDYKSEKSLVKQFWEHTFQCRFAPHTAGWVEAGGAICTGQENLEDVETEFLDTSNLRPEYNVYKAVYALAYALDDILKCEPGKAPFSGWSCTTLQRLEPWQLVHYLQKVNFTTSFGDQVSFDENGDVLPVYDIMNWMWLPDGRTKVQTVGLLISDDDYGLHAARSFQSDLSQSGGGCLAYLEVLPWGEDPVELRRIVRVMKKSTARVVIAFADESHMIDLMEEVVRQNVTGLQWIASEAWVSAVVLQTPQLMPYLGGTLGTAIRRGEIPGLRDFLLQIHPDLPQNSSIGKSLVNQFWEHTFQCRLAPPPAGWVESGGAICTGHEDLENVESEFLDISNLRPEYNVYKAVYALAYAFDDMLRCEPGQGPFSGNSCGSLQRQEAWQLLYYLEKVNFTTPFGDEVSFDGNGDILPIYDIMNWHQLPEGRAKVQNVGEVKKLFFNKEELILDEDKIVWNLKFKEPPRSVCSESCPPGTRMARKKGEPVCCFDCIPCSEGKISNRTDSTECTSCPEDFWSSPQRDHCVPKKTEFLSYNEPLVSGQEEQVVLDETCVGTPPVIGIVGDASSTHCIAISSVVGLYRVPMVSYFATCSCLSDRKRFPSFFRTIPSDAFQVRAVIQILKHFGWTWAGLLISNDDYGLHAARSFQSELSQSGEGCLAYLEILPWGENPAELRRIVDVMKKSTARVVIGFAHDSLMINIIKEVVRQNVTGLQWIATEAWTSAAVLQTPQLMPYLDGTLGTAIRRGEIPGLRDFLLRIHPDLPQNSSIGKSLVNQFWEHTFQCRLAPPPAGWVESGGAICTGHEDLENVESEFLDISNLRPEYNVYKAVYALAYAFDDMLRCEPGQGPFSGNSCGSLQRQEAWQLLYYLEKVNFTTPFGDEVSFDGNGDILPIYDIMNWHQLPDGRAKVQNVGEGQFHLNGMHKTGDVILGGVFQIHFFSTYPDVSFNSEPQQPTCHGFDVIGFRRAQTMAFAIDEINRNSKLLPNVTLGYSLYDNCLQLGVGFRAALSLVSGQEDQVVLDETCVGTPPVIGIVGDSSSTHCIAISSVVGLYRIPMVSYFATCSCLSDRKRFPSFFRTIPSDAFQVRAVIQILKHFGWTWAGLLISNDDYGLHAARSFQSELSQSGEGCLAYLEILPWGENPAELRRIVDVMKKSTARVVIAFAHDSLMINIIKEVVRQNVTGLQWIASEAWTSAAVLQTPQLMPYLGGTLGIAIRHGEIPGFRDFLLQTRPDMQHNNSHENSLVNQFWEDTFQCKFAPPPAGWVETEGALCTGQEDLENVESDLLDVSNLRPEYNIYKAVYALAYGLDAMLQCESELGPFSGHSCGSLQKLEPWQLVYYLERVNFTTTFGDAVSFDENGDVLPIYDIMNWLWLPDGRTEVQNVGEVKKLPFKSEQLTLDEGKIFWNFKLKEPPRSVCSESCPPGTRMARKKGQPVCCFDCIPCSEGKISNETDSTECISCPEDFWSSPQRDHCVPKETEFLSYNEPLGICLTIASLLGTDDFILMSHHGQLVMVSGQEEQVVLDETCVGTPPVIGIVGDSSSTRCIAISSVLGLYKVPMVSYFATCSCLSDRQKYPSFFRTIPSDAFQVRAVIQILKHFGWTWAGLLISDDDYGLYAARSFQSDLSQSGGGCLAYLEILPWGKNPTEVKRIVDVMKKSTARVVIVFAHESHMINIMEEVVRQNVTGLQWIASEAWTSAAVLQTPQLMPYLGGTLGIAIRRGEIPGLRDFLLQTRPDLQHNNSHENSLSHNSLPAMGFRRAQTMAFAIDEINRKSKLLPNVTLGYSLYDHCVQLGIGFRAALSLVSGQEEQVVLDETCVGTPPVIGIVGDSSSTHCIAISSVVGLYRVPMVSYFATCSCLSDRKRFPSFFRTIPSDAFQVRAVIQILKHFGWTWAGLLISNDDYGLHAARSFQSDLSQSGEGCLAYLEILPWGENPAELRRIVDVMKKSTARVVIAFAHDSLMINIIKEVVRQNVTGLQWIASEAWTSAAVLQTPQLMPYLGGTLGIAIRRGEIPGFRDFLLQTRPDLQHNNSHENSLVNQFWEHTFQCKFAPPPAGWVETGGALCTGQEDLENVESELLDVSNLRPEYNIYKAVYALAYGLDAMLQCESELGPFSGHSCGSLQKLEPWQLLYYLERVNFTTTFGDAVSFDDNGDVLPIYDIMNWLWLPDGRIEVQNVGEVKKLPFKKDMLPGFYALKASFFSLRPLPSPQIPQSASVVQRISGQAPSVTTVFLRKQSFSPTMSLLASV